MNRFLAQTTATIKRALDYALNLQHQEGYWVAPLDSNATMEAEYLLFLRFLGADEPIKTQQLVDYIFAQQSDDGSWSLYFQGPGDLSTTVECYFALLVAGISKTDERLTRAKAFILEAGGLLNVRVFTRIWLALFGQWSWSKIPMIPPEIILLPTWFPINIYALASWARATIVPLSLLMMQRPIKVVAAACALDDLISKSAKKDSIFFRFMAKLLQIYHFFPIKWGRKAAIKKNVAWILSHQEADGSWGGIQPPWVYSILALNSMGYSLTHPVVQKGLKGFEHFYIYSKEKDQLQVQACVSPVWDTALMINSCFAAGLQPSHAQLDRACTWLLNKQIFHPGDWHIQQPELEPGGFAFEFENNHYPDIDDTAEVLIALWQAKSSTQSERFDFAIEKGLNWILGMQSKNGGWAAFDKDNHRSILTKFPFFDFGEVLDPPSVDVTAHVLELLGLMGYSRKNPIIQKAIAYIYQEQESDGSWFGRWGVNYLYGTAAVLCALAKIGEDLKSPRLKKAAEFLLRHQKMDGSWGESCASYVDFERRGQGSSTVSQTAWALLGLMAAGFWREPAVASGIQYLCSQMNAANTWDEPFYTGCGFPGYGDGRRKSRHLKNKDALQSAGFMINYHLYRHCWPLMALGTYHQFCQEEMKQMKRSQLRKATRALGTVDSSY